MRVTCKACGRSYDYNKEGTCPECGAFNRPPRRDKVNADGTVRHLTSEEFLEKGHSARPGKVCFEEKECHEKKECHEDAARQVRSQAQNVRKQVQNVRSARPAAAKSSGSKRQSSAVTRLLIIGAVIFFLIIIGNVFSMISSWMTPDYDWMTPDYDWGWQDAFEKEIAVPDDAELVLCSVGDVFIWDGYEVRLKSWTLEGDRGTALIEYVGDPGGVEGILFGEQTFFELPHLEFKIADSWRSVQCSECSVGEDPCAMELVYEVDGEGENMTLVYYSLCPDGPWLQIRVEL